jgi:hypothetical protein
MGSAVQVDGLPPWAPKAAAVLMLASGAIWYYMQPRTYDECMLTEMRGQSQSIYLTVNKVCSRRFNREVPVYSTKGFAWNLVGSIVEAGPSDPEYNEYVMTRASFRFSSKDCKSSSASDFSEPTTERADPRGRFVFALPVGVSSPLCMKTTDAWGKYK